jgi:Icc-related predicted phosphoesterase
VRIQYCSDLHLEFEKNSQYLSKNQLKVCGNILILAGDIVPLHDEFLNNHFFDYISKNYSQVFWVPGNHEYYYRNIFDFGSSFSLKIRENITVLNNTELQFEDIRFVFSTLWTNISEKNEKQIELNVSDFELITNNDRKFRVADYNKLHQESLDFVRQSISSQNNKTVIVTHHLPSVLCNKPSHCRSIINEAFSVDLTNFIETSNAMFWIYGHSHFNQKPLQIGKTYLLTNQLGYVQHNEHNGFRNNAYFAL